jgi:hypothetical protein
MLYLADAFTGACENDNFPFGRAAEFAFRINGGVYIMMYFIDEIERHSRESSLLKKVGERESERERERERESLYGQFTFD